LRGLSRYRTVALVIALAVVTWSALFLVYDYRSPVSQFVRGVGTVQLEGWSAYDLDLQCVRLEATDGLPVTTAQNATVLAQKAHPDGYVREVLLVSFSDTCKKGNVKLAWAVAFAWPVDSYGPLPTGGRPRGIVLVDAVTGKVIANHVEGQPSVSPS
jgi:hypothetical protein